MLKDLIPLADFLLREKSTKPAPASGCTDWGQRDNQREAVGGMGGA